MVVQLANSRVSSSDLLEPDSVPRLARPKRVASFCNLLQKLSALTKQYFGINLVGLHSIPRARGLATSEGEGGHSCNRLQELSGWTASVFALASEVLAPFADRRLALRFIDSERMAVKVNPGGKKMRKLGLLVLAIAAGLIGSQTALAQNYDFTFTTAGSGPDTGVSGTGTFDVSGGLIIGLVGTFTNASDVNYSMTLLPVSGYAQNDNRFSGTAPYFDFSGASFEAGSVDYNLFYQSPGTYILDSVSNPTGQPTPNTPITFSATDVPEGGSSLLYLLLAGGTCFGFMWFGSRYRVGSRTMA